MDNNVLFHGMLIIYLTRLTGRPLPYVGDLSAGWARTCSNMLECGFLTLFDNSAWVDFWKILEN